MRRVFILFIFFILFALPVAAQEKTFFPIQSIDTMKVSRDEARNATTSANIPILVEKVASLNPTHIAVSTPYDEEFYPVLKKWADEVHKRNIKVWFRGNFSGWEGWFDYPKFDNPAVHHEKTYTFIVNHPELFQEGDIFTPAPEPENGVIGDPRNSDENKAAFIDFLQTSYATCQKAFGEINKPVTCGYFSTNGDVAKQILTEDLVKNIGNRVVIDHYVKTQEQLIDDINFLYDKLHAPIVLGEIGAPIPDIHGQMTEDEQANYIHTLLIDLLQVRGKLEGLNYWTAFGGTTAIFSPDFSARSAATYIKEYFTPVSVSGMLKEKNGLAVREATVSFSPTLQTSSNAQGYYSLLTTQDFTMMDIKKTNYVPLQIDLSKQLASASAITKSVTMQQIPKRKQERGILEQIFRFINPRIQPGNKVGIF